jgi:hypothetical protein
VGGKRKRRGNKNAIASDIRRLKDSYAVPGIIRLTDGGFADRLIGKYLWRASGRAARGEMVHRTREQARTPEAVSVQLQLMLRRIRLMVPIHLRIDYRAPVLPQARPDDSARRGDGARRVLTAADASPGRRSAAGRSGGRRETGSGTARPGERHAERRGERPQERRAGRLAGRRGERSGEAPASGRSALRGALPVTAGIPARPESGRIGPAPALFEPPAARAYRLLAAAVRTPLFGRRDGAGVDGRPGVRRPSRAPALLHQQPVRPDASALAALRALQARAAAPAPQTPQRPDASAPAGRADASAARSPAARPTGSESRRTDPAVPAPPRTFSDPDAPVPRRRSVPASPAVSASAEPLALFARTAFGSIAFPAALLPADGDRAAARRGFARRAPTGDAAGAGRPDDAVPSLPFIAARYRPRQRPADGRTAIVHRTEGARGIRDEQLGRLARHVRHERITERMTLARSPERMLRSESAARARADGAGRTDRPRAETAAGGTPGRAAPAEARTASAGSPVRALADRQPPLDMPPVVRRTPATAPAILSHAPSARRAAADAANMTAVSAANAAVNLAAEAAARAAALRLVRAAGAANSGADAGAGRWAAASRAADTSFPSGNAGAERSAGVPRVPVVVARVRAADAAGGTAAANAPSPQAAAPSRIAAPVANLAQFLRAARLVPPPDPASRIFASALRQRSGPGLSRLARTVRGPADGGGTAVPAAHAAGAAQAQPGAGRALPRLVTLQPPVLPVAQAFGFAAHAPSDGRTAARDAAYVRVARLTPPEREIARPYSPPRRTVPAIAARGQAGAAIAQSGAAATPATLHIAGRGDMPALPTTPGITPVVRRTVRSGVANVPLARRRSLPTAAAPAGLATPPGVQAASAPRRAGAPLPAELHIASAGRQVAPAAEAVARGFDGVTRTHEHRQVREVPLQVAARPAPRLSEASPVIRELKTALRGVEQELSRMKEDKPAPAIDYKRLTDDLYKAVNRRLRLDSFRRGF